MADHKVEKEAQDRAYLGSFRTAFYLLVAASYGRVSQNSTLRKERG